jgi:uncharacterized protein (UPF0335 family)
LSVDKILEMYVEALGGQDTINKINSREIHATLHGGPSLLEGLLGKEKTIPGVAPRKVTCYWQKPDKVVETVSTVNGIVETIGFDGRSAWRVVPKRKTHRPDRDEQDDLETLGNPLRFVFLKTLYSTVQLEKGNTTESKRMDVLSTTTDDGVRKFYFDSKTHLLMEVTKIETGQNFSFKRDVHFQNYRRVDGILYPFRISFAASDTPTVEIKVSKLLQNVPIDPKQLARP